MRHLTHWVLEREGGRGTQSCQSGATDGLYMVGFYTIGSIAKKISFCHHYVPPFEMRTRDWGGI